MININEQTFIPYPHNIHAQFLNMIQVWNQTWYITNTIAIGILEWAWIHLVDTCLLPPGMRNLGLRCAVCHNRIVLCSVTGITDLWYQGWHCVCWKSFFLFLLFRACLSSRPQQFREVVENGLINVCHGQRLHKWKGTIMQSLKQERMSFRIDQDLASCQSYHMGTAGIYHDDDDDDSLEQHPLSSSFLRSWSSCFCLCRKGKNCQSIMGFLNWIMDRQS